MVVKNKSKRITSGISQTGGKYRLVNRLMEVTPYHEFFLSMFTGAAHFELNKPRCRYECWNDGESEIINYLVQIWKHPKEFDDMKQGVFGLVSQEICNRIVNGKLKPKNDLERAYFFYYLNKLTFGGSIWKVRKNPETGGGLIKNRVLPNISKKIVADAKEEFETKTKGYRGITLGSLGKPLQEKDIEEIKAKFRGVILPTVCKEKSVEEAKANYSGIGSSAARTHTLDTPYIDKAKERFKNVNAPYAGIHNTRALGSSANKRDLEKTKEQFKSVAYKGTNPKTTRPFTNNDCGLLSPINPEAIKRLRYVNLTAYDFRKVYKMFYEAFYVRKGLERECFIYADPPFPGTEKYYGDLFPPELHQDLLDLMLETPFNFMLSIGGECEFYLEQLKDWNILPVKVKYSTSANHQKDSQEFIITNYEIQEIAKMIYPSNQKLMEKYF